MPVENADGTSWYREFIAFPCVSGFKYSMPLGLLLYDSLAYGRVFRGAGLYRLAGRIDGMLLLSPDDPLLFYKSLKHELENKIKYCGSCPCPDPRLGSWYSCTPQLYSDTGDFKPLTCTNLKPQLSGLHTITAYSRVYGCLVELLVYCTRVLAGVWGRSPSVEAYLAGCAIRASRGDRRVVETVSEILQCLRGHVRSPLTG
ncbi:MAG: hypothetical protein LRS48_00880 [Desulfurococcales archaeon]|nr:hypothetical protein [Desulfurococcales archaeon]